MIETDLLVVGAGPVGCVVAEQAASQLGWKCLVLDRRNHIAGNCYDAPHSSGVLIHRYGPHYFRTSNAAIVNYLSKFTEWLPADYKVRSAVDGVLYPFPINLTTLEMFFKRSFTESSARRFLRTTRQPIAKPRNAEEELLNSIGPTLHRNFFAGYTQKQWGVSAKRLDASVLRRVPIRFTRDERYVLDSFQKMPARGFTALFQKMLTHRKIQVLLNSDYREMKNKIHARRATVYCGPLDDYFDFRLGPLPWRSLRFQFKTYRQEYRQPCVQINYPNEHAYTRSVEIKHVTRQKHPMTVISYEYPRHEGEPFYPVLSEKSIVLSEHYSRLAHQETLQSHVYFAGRLAQYIYINTDEAVGIGLNTFERIKNELLHA